MIVFAPTPREDMERRAAEVKAARRAASPIPPRRAAKNLAVVLTLDQATFFTFRGRPFGVPPLPWETGEKLLDLHSRATDAALQMARGAAEGKANREAMAEYFDAIAALPPILWAHCFPASRPLRLLRRLGVLRNPFATAPDRELMEITAFFLSRRTRSSVQFSPATTQPPPRGISSRSA